MGRSSVHMLVVEKRFRHKDRLILTSSYMSAELVQPHVIGNISNCAQS